MDLVQQRIRVGDSTRSKTFLIYLLALIGLFYALRSREPVYFLLLAHIAYFVAFHSALNVQYRFICPLMSYMILLAGLPVYRVDSPLVTATRDPHYRSQPAPSSPW